MKYAREREAFGRPIAANQAIAFKIARRRRGPTQTKKREAASDEAAPLLK